MKKHKIELLTDAKKVNLRGFMLGCSPGWCGPVDHCLPDDKPHDDNNEKKDINNRIDI